MKKILLILSLFTTFACQTDDERCGQIIQKVEINGGFYFVLQTDEFINQFNTPNRPSLPDDGVRQGSVTKGIYDSFEVGDDYCSEA
jgi:hypothetical protein